MNAKFLKWDRNTKGWLGTLTLNEEGDFYQGMTDPTSKYDWCQYIGVNDKEGQEIYEGSILEYNAYNGVAYDYIVYDLLTWKLRREHIQGFHRMKVVGHVLVDSDREKYKIFLE